MASLTSVYNSRIPTAASAVSPLRWLSVVPHVDRRFGGLTSVVPRFASKIGETGEIAMSVAAFCAPDESCPNHLSSEFAISKWPLGRFAWLTDNSLSGRFNDIARNMDGLHIHGLWEQSGVIGIRAARSLRLPYLISAHGMLDAWALRNKRLKKAVYSALVERSQVRNATCLHALTRSEADDYRRYGARGPIAVIPNGVEPPASLSSLMFLNHFPCLQSKRLVLYLGRIHFKKGLDILVRAWRHVVSQHRDVHLVLAGPDFENSQAAIMERVNNYGIAQHVTFTGMLQEEMKWSALAAAECFVLPSYSEGLSVSALEAMSAGLPVILSDRCNLPEVEEIEAGLIIPAEVNPLQDALARILGNSAATNLAIGQRGRHYVMAQYNWDIVARKMSQVYLWMAGGNIPTLLDLERSGGRR